MSRTRSDRRLCFSTTPAKMSMIYLTHYQTQQRLATKNPLEKAIDALTSYFTPKKNVAYEEYLFRQAKQDPEEKIMAYYTCLKHLSQTCEFADADREIKTQIIQHYTSSKLRRKALNEPATTLQALLEYGKTLELTASHISALENQQTEGVNEVNKHVGNRQKSRNGNGGMDAGNLEWILGTRTIRIWIEQHKI